MRKTRVALYLTTHAFGVRWNCLYKIPQQKKFALLEHNGVFYKVSYRHFCYFCLKRFHAEERT